MQAKESYEELQKICLECLKRRAHIYQTLKHDFQPTIQKQNGKAFPKCLKAGIYLEAKDETM